MTKTVILFKSPVRDACAKAVPDPYNHLLSSTKRYTPISLPVLDEAFMNEDELDGIIERGASTWSGVVGTSQRAGFAWSRAVQRVAGKRGEDDYNEQGDDARFDESKWNSIPLYTPGRATSFSFINFNAPKHYMPSPYPGVAESTGSASALGEFIVEHHLSDKVNGDKKGKDQPLLILQGDKTLPDLTDCLSNASPAVPFQVLEVYRTGIRKDLSERLIELINLLSENTQSSETKIVWLAFFSPSSAVPVIKTLRSIGYFQDQVNGAVGQSTARLIFKIASIGSTTSTHLVENEGLDVDAVAESPTAKGLADALLRADS